jgi:phospholipid/cholesterol/gamma-HCH transport system permease protein
MRAGGFPRRAPVAAAAAGAPRAVPVAHVVDNFPGRARMRFTTDLLGALREAGNATVHWLAGWWRLVHFAALMAALTLSRSSYRRQYRAAIARHLYRGTAPMLPWFTVVTALVSLILIHIVVVTAQGYGLSKYSLEMVVRVLVMELIPLIAALFAALQYAIPASSQLIVLRTGGDPPAPRHEDIADLQRDVLPRVLTGVFAVLLLACVSCVMTLVLAYLSVYGLALAGFAAYTHTVGQIFSPAVALVFALKIALFSLAVALIPVASVLRESRRGEPRASVELHSLVRMFVVLLLVEGASLVVSYY